MVFDAHDRAFALFKGTCGRGIYDNMKTAVETISSARIVATIAASKRNGQSSFPMLVGSTDSTRCRIGLEDLSGALRQQQILGAASAVGPG
jgi:transposase